MLLFAAVGKNPHLGSGLLTYAASPASYGALNLSAGTFEMNGNSVACGSPSSIAVDISGGVLNLSGQISGGSAECDVSGGTINDTGSAGEITAGSGTFTGGTSVIRKLTLSGAYSQSSTSTVTITESATYDSWTMSGTDFTFKTTGIPTWSAGSLTMVGGDSWTFGG